MIPVRFQDWGLIPYSEALVRQKIFQDSLVAYKLEQRNRTNAAIYPEVSTSYAPLDSYPNQYLIFCEHPPVYTLGNRANGAHLLLSQSELLEKGISVFPIRRGGDITYHGPGQLVGYPILDLELFFTDIHRYLRYIEEAVIQTLDKVGIKAGRISGLSGVWVESDNEMKARKICAIGVHCSRWVTMHGFSLNVNTELSPFQDIIPCGIRDKGVTSIAKELGEVINMESIHSILKEKLAHQFGMEIQE
jgi:lipoyl(octanoyl) transferase